MPIFTLYLAVYACFGLHLAQILLHLRQLMGMTHACLVRPITLSSHRAERSLARILLNSMQLRA